MSKDKKGQFDHYQTFELEDGTKFKALNEEQAKLYVAKAKTMAAQLSSVFIRIFSRSDSFHFTHTAFS